MKTTDKEISGSCTILKINVNDAINVKAHVKKLVPNLHWSDLKKCYAVRHRYGISYAIPNLISGDIRL